MESSCRTSNPPARPSAPTAAASSPASAAAGRFAAPATALASAALAIALVLALCLTGCESQPAAQSSAARIGFGAALAADYDAALDAVTDRADDAKLLAVSSETFAQAHFPSDWTFLFYSWSRASAYTVRVADGQATVTDNPGLSLTREDFDAIPEPADIAWDSDQAYSQAMGQLDGQGEYLTCRAYLMTYVPEDDDPAADAFEWFFTFNDEQDLRSIYLDPDAEIAPAATVAVDARTGRAERRA